MSNPINPKIFGIPGYSQTYLFGESLDSLFGAVGSNSPPVSAGLVSTILGNSIVNVSGYTFAEALGGNSFGTVFGNAYNSTGPLVPFIQQNGTTTLLNSQTTAGLTPVGADEFGDVLLNGIESGASYTFNHGQFTPVAISGATSVHASAISEFGTIAGTCAIDGQELGFVGLGGFYTTFSVGSGPIYVSAVNDEGEVAGFVAGSGDKTGIYLYNHGATTFVPGVTGGIVSLNDEGVAVGNNSGSAFRNSYVRFPTGELEQITAQGYGTTIVTQISLFDQVVGYAYGTVANSSAPEVVGLITSVAPCFATGTMLLTPVGERSVEAIRPGEIVVLVDGSTAKVMWVGHRRHFNGEVIRVSAGALGQSIPIRDLVVSDDHGLYLDGLLVQAGLLVNGETIVRERREAVMFWHVELENHAILLADGVPAESYLDTGNRTQFSNCSLTYDPTKPGGDVCAEMVFAGRRLEALRRRLRAADNAGARQVEPASW